VVWLTRPRSGPGGPLRVKRPPTVRPPRLAARPRLAPVRPPQFLVVSFDGAGGVRLWPYWLAVAQRAHAHFTFFVSGVYLLTWARHDLYRPPQHSVGSSDIGFALTEEGLSGHDAVRG